MALQEFIRESFEVNWEWFERYINGLSQEEIEFRPTGECHSIGFILWHYGRALDMWTQTLARKQPQLYEREWAQRLGFEPEAMNVGFGYSVEDLANWQCPDKALLVEYATAARENLLGFLSEHDDESLTGTMMTNRQGAEITLSTMFRMLVWGGQPARRSGRIPARDAAGTRRMTGGAGVHPGQHDTGIAPKRFRRRPPGEWR